MASPDVLNFAELLKPIHGDKPTGVDLRTDTASPAKGRELYDKIRSARTSAREAERSTSNGRAEPGKNPDWAAVRQDIEKALAERSKDLELAVYLIEALVRLKGFAGLRDGFRLARELTEKYWDRLYPAPDEQATDADGKPSGPLTFEDRLMPLLSLNGESRPGTLIAPIKWVPITGQTSFGQFSTLDYFEADDLNKVADPKERERKVADGVATLEKFQDAVAETEAKFYLELMQDLDACEKELTALSTALTARKIPGGFASSQIKEALGGCRDTIKRVAASKLIVAAPAAGAKGPGNGPPGKPAGPPGAINTREEAVGTLRRVAEFFRRTEPHTPVHYAVEQAARWADMKLPDLLVELIPEEAARKNLFKLVGIEPPAPKGKDSK